MAIGIAIFLTDKLEIGNAGINEAVLFMYSALKSYLYIKLLFGRVKETAQAQFHYTEIFKFIALNTFLFILSYAIDYSCLYEIDGASFSGVKPDEPLVYKLAAFFYFSIATFSTAGFGDITPLSITARLLTSAEMLLAWFLTVLVVANFSSIRKSIKRDQ